MTSMADQSDEKDEDALSERLREGLDQQLDRAPLDRMKNRLRRALTEQDKEEDQSPSSTQQGSL